LAELPADSEVDERVFQIGCGDTEASVVDTTCLEEADTVVAVDDVGVAA
jgi:hypothetical protein